MYKVTRFLLTFCELTLFILTLMFVLSGYMFNGVICVFGIFYCMLEKRYSTLSEKVNAMQADMQRIYLTILHHHFANKSDKKDDNK
jgi:hypothetical protein